MSRKQMFTLHYVTKVKESGIKAEDGIHYVTKVKESGIKAEELNLTIASSQQII
ncbi:hypothetical protein MX629_12900 [Carnobacterium divergens]|uniref:hypothetical protein n=1 Tax=Carnobacterium divergens TaxID=2748 RepID=UPI002890466C|nr:hypothetical protein [Carnobacterium divergens]MDT1959334.1 hypothetical protein [Carnobacterium divergens]